MQKIGKKFRINEVEHWFDCGDKNRSIDSNRRYMKYMMGNKSFIHESSSIEDSVIIDPVYIDKGTKIKGCIIGPYASISSNNMIARSILSNCIIQDNSSIEGINCSKSIIGNNAQYQSIPKELSIGDFCSLKE